MNNCDDRLASSVLRRAAARTISDSFNHEFHEWTNDTNLFRFNIREIRLFVPFVIPEHSISHPHNSTRHLQRELPKIRNKTAEDAEGRGGSVKQPLRTSAHSAVKHRS
jgi:hypothetical protein